MKTILSIILFASMFAGQQALAGPWSDVLDTPHQNSEKVKEMIKSGMDVNKPEASGWDNSLRYPLAMVYGDSNESLKIRNLIISAGAKVNQVDGKGRTALHKEVGEGNLRGMKFLIENGANVNHKDKEGNSPLLIATPQARPKTIKILLNSGADVMATDKDGRTVLHLLTYSYNEAGVMPVAKLLVEHGANIRAQSGIHGTPLHHAVEMKKTDVAEFLLSKGVDVNLRKDVNGVTPLHSVGTNVSSAKLLLKHGADIEARSDDGSTPLLSATLIASLFNKPEIIQLLVDQGAIVDVKDNKGQTPISRASGKVRDILLAALNKQSTTPKGIDLSLVVNSFASHVDKVEQAYQQSKEKAIKVQGFSGLTTQREIKKRLETFREYRDRTIELNSLLKDATSIVWKTAQENKVTTSRETVENAVVKKFGSRLGNDAMRNFQAQFYWADAYSNILDMLDKNWNDWKADEANMTIETSNNELQEYFNKEISVIGKVEAMLGQMEMK